MSNKKKKGIKRIKTIEYRTLENRKEKVKELIKELTKFELNPKYEPIKKLYQEFKKYIIPQTEYFRLDNKQIREISMRISSFYDPKDITLIQF